MKLFKYFLKKRVVYSCVIDDKAKFYSQGYKFVKSLIEIAKVEADRIYIHLTTKNIEFENFLHDNGVNIKYIEKWGDKTYCNKLQQLETIELQKADYVYFCDVDIIILEDLDKLAKEKKYHIVGKTVDFDNPSLDILKKIYDIYDISHPYISSNTINNNPTFENNFNGGLYGISSKKLKNFSETWKYYASDMLNSSEIKELLKEKINHIDQISFSLALNKLQYKYNLLDYIYNCPTHIKDNIDNKIKSNVKVIHYHSNISKLGLLNNVENKLINNSINIINSLLKNDIKGLFKANQIGLNRVKAPNDIYDITILDSIKKDEINKNLLLESVEVSRACFGWFTKHYPRVYEYPWLIENIDIDLKDKVVADFGAGISALPIQLSLRGAKVYTIDNHTIIRDLKSMHNVNEWGFFDYSILDKNITSINKSLTTTTFQSSSIDIWYSISVVEHLHSEVRSIIFEIIKNTLKNNGLLLLTIDLIKGSNDLWNMVSGKIVEEQENHGTLDSFIQELEILGFIIESAQTIRMPKDERVDISMIKARLVK